MKNIETAGVYQSKEVSKLFYCLLFMFSICLNQTSIIGGFNFSLSDVIIIGLLFCLVYQGLRVPSYYFIYFLFLSALLLITASFFTPFYFHVSFGISSILKDYIKLLVSFFYFIVGYNLIKGKLMKITLKWYSCFALIVGSLGIFTSLIKIPFLIQLLYFGDVRYKGFMNDPNLFSIVQISSLPFFLRSEKLSFTLKLIIYTIILSSTILSGSKTGFITLIIYTFLMILVSALKKGISLQGIFFTLCIGVLICLLYLLIAEFHLPDIINFSDKSFQMKRISTLFTDFNSAVNDSGSSRLSVWKTGIDIIKLSPLIGVGVGVYPEVSDRVSGINQVAHNTYIQFFSEWGGIFAATFFIFLVLLILKVSFSKRLNHGVNLILRDILIIILIGSLAISLNNARIFWFFIGGLACGVNQEQVYKSKKKSQVRMTEKNPCLMEGKL